MYSIKATLRKSRKEDKPGYILFKIRNKAGTERFFATGIPSTDEELTTKNKDYVLRGLKCLYDIVERFNDNGEDGDIDEIASAFRKRLANGDDFSDVGIKDFKIDRKIASIGLPFKSIIESTYSGKEKYSFGHVLVVSNLTDFITSLLVADGASMRSGTIRNYRSMRRTLSDFIATLSDKKGLIDSGFVGNFHMWLKTQNLSDSTVSFYMRVFRAILNKAKEMGLIAMSHNWFSGLIKHFAVDEEKNRINSLTKGEINSIANAKIADDPLMELSRDLFMFSFYCRGMELFDILNLTPDNIHGDVIIYNKRLTGRQQIVKIEPQTERIIEKYIPESNGYIFSVITKFSKSREYNTLRRLVMPKLAELGKLLGIQTPIMFSTAKNTWTELTKESNLASMILS